jgi:hypothetical protein
MILFITGRRPEASFFEYENYLCPYISKSSIRKSGLL